MDRHDEAVEKMIDQEGRPMEYPRGSKINPLTNMKARLILIGILLCVALVGIVISLHPWSEKTDSNVQLIPPEDSLFYIAGAKCLSTADDFINIKLEYDQLLRIGTDSKRIDETKATLLKLLPLQKQVYKISSDAIRDFTEDPANTTSFGSAYANVLVATFDLLAIQSELCETYISIDIDPVDDFDKYVETRNDLAELIGKSTR